MQTLYTYHPLSVREKQGKLTRLLHIYLSGGCAVFALMLNREFREPIIGLSEPSGRLDHVVTRTRKGLLRDARGVFEESALEGAFTLKRMTPREVRAWYRKENQGEPSERLEQHIALAKERAMVIHHDWRWKNGTDMTDIDRFMEGLARLTKETGIAISSTIPAQPMVVRRVDEGDLRTYTAWEGDNGPAVFVHFGHEDLKLWPGEDDPEATLG